jgi:acetolactate synthase-1/2/3 large subunit
VLGDGAFQMSFCELATVRALGLPIKIILLNNQNLGLVRELQKKSGAEAFAVDLSGYPDYGTIAAAYGIAYSRAGNLHEALSSVRAMLECDGAYILECAVDPEEPTI